MPDFVATNPFVYRTPTYPFDWRLLASVDVEGALATQDVARMQPLVDSLAFGEVDAPPGLQKVFRAQQFMLQYLIYAQNELLLQLQQSPNGDIEKLKEENEQLKRELKEERQKRSADNMMMRMASLNPQLVEAMPRCLECGKAFADYRFLVAHYQRRHPGKEIPRPSIPNYKIERPEYKLCNCKIEAPAPQIVQQMLPPPPPPQKEQSSDIFMPREEMDVKLQQKSLVESMTQATSPGAVFHQMYDSAYKPQDANFSNMTTTRKSAIGVQNTPTSVQMPRKQPQTQTQPVQQQIIYDPYANAVSFSSDDAVIRSGFRHTRQEVNQQLEELKRQFNIQ